MPCASVDVEPEVHTNLVATNIVDVAPLQADESSFGSSLGEGNSQSRGDDTVRFEKCPS